MGFTFAWRASGFSIHGRNGTFCVTVIIWDPKNMALNKCPNTWAANLEVLPVAFGEGN